MYLNDHAFSLKMGEFKVADELPHGSDARIVMVPHLELLGSSILASQADAIDLTMLVSHIAKKAAAPREAMRRLGPCGWVRLTRIAS